MTGTDRPLGRRELLLGAGGIALGAAATWGIGTRTDSAADRPYPGTSGAPQGVGAEPAAQAGRYGAAVVDCHGRHQAGITTSPQGFLSLTGFDLRDGVTLTSMARLMRLWTEDIEWLTAGAATITDTEPELAHLPASLTITVGFGPDLFSKLGIDDARPPWLKQLPSYSIDDLDPAYVGGDIAVQVCADDPVTVAHAARLLAKEATAYASPRWTQYGSRNAPGIAKEGATMRNHFGQLDGTGNPDPHDEPSLVFRSGGDLWLDGGSTMVVRRIAMDLDGWDELDVPARDVVLGRSQETGAPLTGTAEFDEPDLAAKNSLGFPVIDVAAHIRRARTDDGSQRILRKPYNYSAEPGPGQISNAGLIFLTYQADIDHQFLPVQERLAELDLLNQWTTPIGSAVFAVPRGFNRGEILAEDLFGRAT